MSSPSGRLRASDPPAPPAGFPSAEEEVSFWKARAEEMGAAAKEARDELEEFQVRYRGFSALFAPILHFCLDWRRWNVHFLRNESDVLT